MATIAVAATLTMAACAGDGVPTTAVPSDAVALAAKGSGAFPTCTFRNVENAADAYAAEGDALFTLIATFKSAYGTGRGNPVAATPAGFAVLRRVGELAALPGGVDKAAGGATLVMESLACMTVSGYPASGATAASVEAGFTQALGSGGLFGVRNDGTTTANDAVVSKGANVFGVERSVGATWPGAFGANPVLFVGYQLTRAQLTSAFGDAAAGQPFELTTLPSFTGTNFDPKVKVGTCAVDLNVGRVRFLHKYSGQSPKIFAALEAGNELTFCAPTAPETMGGAITSFDIFEGGLGEDVPPARGGGALLSGLSPGGPVTFNVSIAFLEQIRNSSASTMVNQLNIKVKVSSANSGNPVVGVPVLIEVLNNQGTAIRDYSSVLYTGNDGIALSGSNVQIPKAGGYTLRATTFNASASSNLFNINGK